MIQGSLIRPGLISIWTKLIGVPTIGPSCDSAQILPDYTVLTHMYTVVQYWSTCQQCVCCVQSWRGRSQGLFRPIRLAFHGGC